MSQLSNNLLVLLNEQYAHEKQNQLIYEQSASVADTDERTVKVGRYPQQRTNRPV